MSEKAKERSKEKPKPTVQCKESDAIRFIKWVIRHKRTESGLTPPQYIINIARKYDWFYTGIAYRGLKMHGWNDEHKKITKKLIGDKTRYESREYDSWTKNKHIAISFSVGNYHSLLSRGVIIESAQFFGSHGIVIKGNIKNGLDIDRALSDLENIAETNLVISDSLANMPGLGTEGEILGQSVGLVEIVDKINC